MCFWVVYISKSWLIQAVASRVPWISFDDMSPNCVVVSLRLRLFKSCETWHENRDIGVSRLKLWELLTCNSHPLLSPLLCSTHLFPPLMFAASCPSPAVTFHPPCLMMWSFLLPPFIQCLHASLLSPRGSWDGGLRGIEGRLGLPLLAALSPFTLTLVYPPQSLQLSSLYLYPSLSSLLP